MTQIDQIQYMFSKLKKYGYENYIIVVIPTNPNSVFNLNLHMGCCNPTLAKCGGEAQHLEKLGTWNPPRLPNV